VTPISTALLTLAVTSVVLGAGAVLAGLLWTREIQRIELGRRALSVGAGGCLLGALLLVLGVLM
jgi:hypothetical protein